MKRSLGTTLFLYVLSGALVGLGGMSFFFYQILEKQAKNDIQAQLNTEVRLIERQLAEVERTGINLAIAVKNLKEQGINNPKAYEDLLLETYLQRPELTMAIGFGQTSYGILDDRQWYWPYFYQDAKVSGQIGKNLPEPYQDSRFAELFADDNYPEQAYYKLVVQSGKNLWMEPYAWYVFTMTTYLVPILDRQNKLIGMTGIDVNVSNISKAIDKPVFSGGGYYAIVSQEGRILAYPPDPQKAESLATFKDIPEAQEFWRVVNTQSLNQNQRLLQINQNYWGYQKIQGTNWIMLAVVPRNLIFQPVLIVTVSGAVGAGIVLAIVVMIFVWYLNRRLQPIVEKCQSIIIQQPQTSNQLNEKVSFQGDELEVLSRSFYQMVEQLQDNLDSTAKLNKALDKFVPRQFLEFLNKKNLVDIKLGDQVQQELSIFFSDIRNFTAMSEVMTPEENFQFVNYYFSQVSPVISENNGFVDKYIGDALMALFSNQADDAVESGLGILRRLEVYNQERKEKGLTAIEIGIGINTGNLMVGTVGETNRMENTVISDAVNIAARVEGLTKTYRVPLLITQQTLDKLSNPSAYAMRMLEQVKVKGKSQPITVYEVFENDPPELKQRKTDNQPLFEQAITHFQLYCFEKAEALFQQCLLQNPQDYVLQNYIDRCQEKIFRFKVSTLEQSFESIKYDILDISETFYRILFEKYPQVKPMFAETDIYAQQQKFARSLELMVENLRRPEAVSHTLRDLGSKHASFGVIAEHYPIVRGVLLEAFAIHMKDAWTVEVADAWDQAFSLVQEMMLSGV